MNRLENELKAIKVQKELYKKRLNEDKDLNSSEKFSLRNKIRLLREREEFLLREVER